MIKLEDFDPNMVQSPTFVSRAKRRAEEAIGFEKAMRLDNRTTVKGTIVECELIGFRTTGRGIVAVFGIVLECGTAKALKEFTCEKLPH